MGMLMVAGTCLPVHAQDAKMPERIPYNQYKVHTNYKQQPQDASLKGMELTDAGGKTYSCITANGQAYLLRKNRSTCDTLAKQVFPYKAAYIQVDGRGSKARFSLGHFRGTLFPFGPELNIRHSKYAQAQASTLGDAKYKCLSVHPQGPELVDQYKNQYTKRIEVIELTKHQAQSLAQTEAINEHGVYTKVHTPTLMIFHPKQTNGAAIVALPGGGYGAVAFQHEGIDMGAWMNKQGITFAVLKYRLPNGDRYVPIQDGQEAIRYMRQHAKEWKLDAKKIGIMGSSAGGHLATTLATHYTEMTRPDFQVLFYPVVTMGKNTHKGSRNNLLGKDADRRLICEYSNELRVTDDTPPAIIFVSEDDGAVPPVNSINYDQALRAHGVSSELHLYPTGGHGWGFRESFKYHKDIVEAFEKWFQSTIQKAP